jgi:hypothetical protein
LRLPHAPSYDTMLCEASMPFMLRLNLRFPVHCSVTYHSGLFRQRGTMGKRHAAT